MPMLELADCSLYYEVTGSGPALVFAHGLAGNHLSWWQQVPHFRDRYTCVTFAHRGFSPSTAAGRPDPRGFAGDLAALIDHLALQDVRLVAQSMGGWSCLGYALREPARVRALVLACTTGTLSHPEIDAPMAAARAANVTAGLLARGIHPAAGARMAEEQAVLHFLYRGIDGLSGGLDKPTLRDALMAARTTTAAEVAHLTIPVLCITGEEDVVIPPASVAAAASLLPNARLARVPRAGHSVYFERAETFNRLVDDFLKQVDAGA